MADKIFTPEADHTYGEVSQLIQGKTYQEKCKIKADEYSKLKIKNFIVDGYEIDIKIKGETNNALEVDIKAKKDGKDIKIDNPCYFHNPPIMVRKGTFYKKLEKDTLYGDIYVNVPNTIENLEESLKEFVYDLVKLMDK